MPRNTTTALFDSEGNNRTATHLSTNIVITCNGNTIGALQELLINEARGGIKMIDEIGTDGHIDSAPNGSTNYSVSANRVRFARTRIAEAFSRPFIHVKSQRIPFDIEIHDIFHDADPGNAIITVVKNIWIKSISYSYSSDNWIIADKMEMDAEDIYSLLNGGNVVGTIGSGMTNPIVLNPFEQQADRGQYRGALDAPGLLNAFLTD
jgi:hypothetical protein